MQLVNLLSLISCIFFPPLIAVYYLAFGSIKGFGTAAMPIIGRQMQLARNGQLVLSAMFRNLGALLLLLLLSVPRPFHSSLCLSASRSLDPSTAALLLFALSPAASACAL